MELVPRIPVHWWDSGPALRFPNQAQFHPLRYVEGLARALQASGGRIHTGNHVGDVQGGAQPRVAGEGFSVSAAAVVVCTNSPISDFVKMHTKQAPYRTFVVASPIPASSMPPLLLWDTLDPYHYVRTQPVDGDPEKVWLIGGGEDHDKASVGDCHRCLPRMFPLMFYAPRPDAAGMRSTDHNAGGATGAVWPERLSASATKPFAFMSSTKLRR